MREERKKTAATKKPRLKPIVCKPCWELKYCPYGPPVEFFPLPGPGLPIRVVRKRYKEWLDAVRGGELKTAQQGAATDGRRRDGPCGFERLSGARSRLNAESFGGSSEDPKQGWRRMNRVETGRWANSPSIGEPRAEQSPDFPWSFAP